MRAVTRGHKPDYTLLVIVAGLLSVGLVVVYSVSPGMSALSGISETYYISKQLLSIALGVIAFFALYKLPYRNLTKFILPLVALSILATIAVQIFGQEINGAQRWIQIGSISFQPAEMVKFTLLIWLADLLARQKRDGKLANFDKTLKPILIAMAAVAIGLGILQSDFGSTVVIVSMIASMMFVSGVPFMRLLKIGMVVLVGMAILIIPSSYRRGRVATFLNPTADCQNAGYQSCQALIAVGSGGLFGLGLAGSVQAYGYLPEAANDSIFAIVAEKFGFVGVSIIIAMFATLFVRLTRITEKAPDEFSRLIVTGTLAWFSVQAIINIGAMLGLLPLKGITLPFISYGGTSLLFVMGTLGLIFQISKYRTLAGKIRVNNEDNANRRGQRRPHYSTVSRRV